MVGFRGGFPFCLLASNMMTCQPSPAPRAKTPDMFAWTWTKIPKKKVEIRTGCVGLG
ncbi:hypothetical protein B0H65DRAFT_462675 [Neurospora tetraspora]|uniref:Uncharacterized protein n=1 Tax=Neurospora tetraspora TaxID=94610 RepID=A0AAE0JHW8_9PEZI|nr:hypothetical protein B0H65DRAFT_462675 [Neurospora tetraspora]